ncbi:hypothetical protein BC834DRAFT_975407 [Gloeopeniophorella convolvens]|nr:hypothetical protein BC834DRAFT_975407 [Gloeopeniophorella convolvens]
MDKPPPLLQRLYLESYHHPSALPASFLGGVIPQLLEPHLTNLLPPLPTLPNIVHFYFHLEGGLENWDADWMDGLVAGLHAMPSLEHLTISVEDQRFFIPQDAPLVTLSKLHMFHFKGASDHLEAVVSKIAAPFLQKLNADISFLSMATAPSFSQFVHHASGLIIAAASLGLSAHYLHHKDHLKDDIEIWLYYNQDKPGGFRPKLLNLETLILNFDSNPGYHRLGLADMADSAHWRTLLCECGAVTDLWVDHSVAVPLTETLEIFGSSLLPSLRKMWICFFQDVDQGGIGAGDNSDDEDEIDDSDDSASDDDDGADAAENNDNGDDNAYPVAHTPPAFAAVEDMQHLRAVTIHSLPDEALLEIFAFHRLLVLDDPPSWRRAPWYRLVPAHVCHRWRQVITASPKLLELHILCDWGWPVADILRHSPAFPILIDYSYIYAWGLEWNDKVADDALLALEHFERTQELSLDAPPRLLEKFAPMIGESAPALKTLLLSSSSRIVVLPENLSNMVAPNLETLRLKNVLFFSLPPFSNLVELKVWIFETMQDEDQSWLGIDQLIERISSMRHLKVLTLIFPHHNFRHSIGAATPLHPGGTCTTLPALSILRFLGSSAHVEPFMSRIVAPNLSSFTIDIYDAESIAIPSFAGFIKSATIPSSTIAHVGLTRDSLHMSFCSESPGLASIEFRVSHESPLEMTQTVATMIEALSPVIPTTETLILGFNSDHISQYFTPASNPAHWPDIFLSFKAVKALRIDNHSASPASFALREFASSNLLPKLRELSLSFCVSYTDLNPCKELKKFRPLWEERHAPVKVSCGDDTRRPLVAVTIHSLPDEVLLEMFVFHRLLVLDDPPSLRRTPWYKLVPAHVCRRWHQAITASPKRLALHVLCDLGEPVADVLRHSPTYPLLINYSYMDIMEFQWGDGLADDTLLALEHFDRTRELSLYAPPELLVRFLPMIKECAPALEILELSCDSRIVLPENLSNSVAPNLEALHLTNVLFFSLPSFSNLVNLGKAGVDQLIERIICMHHLKDLSLTFSHRNFHYSTGAATSLCPGDTRTTLPALSVLHFTGSSAHVEPFMSKFTAPNLSRLTVDIYDMEMLNVPSFAGFIKSATIPPSTIAHVGLMDDSLPVSFYSGLPGLASIEFRVSHESSLWMARTVTRMIKALSPIIPTTEPLILSFNSNHISMAYSTPTDDPTHWAVILESFRAVRTLRIDNHSAPPVSYVLKEFASFNLLPKLGELSLFFNVFDTFWESITSP